MILRDRVTMFILNLPLYAQLRHHGSDMMSHTVKSRRFVKIFYYLPLARASTEQRCWYHMQQWSMTCFGNLVHAVTCPFRPRARRLINTTRTRFVPLEDVLIMRQQETHAWYPHHCGRDVS